MNIYLISQTRNDDYNTYDAAVVIAETSEQARRMYPRDGSDITKPRDHWLENPERDWVANPALVTVRLLGRAENQEVGVVLASFNSM